MTHTAPTQNTSKTILDQLGGRRFIMMTGAKNFLTDGSDLTFSIPSARNGINRVQIKLNELDLYDIEFGRYQSLNYRTKAVLTNISCSALRETFTAHTGLYTAL